MNHKKKLSLRHPLSIFGSFSIFQASLWVGVDKVPQKLIKSLKSELKHAFQCCILIPRKCLHQTPFQHTVSPPAPTALQCLANDGALVTSGALVNTGLTLFDNNAILSLDSGRVRTFLSPLDTRFCVSLFNRLSPNDQIAARAKILSPCWPNHSVKVKRIYICRKKVSLWQNEIPTWNTLKEIFQYPERLSLFRRNK